VLGVSKWYKEGLASDGVGERSQRVFGECWCVYLFSKT
jgi:hypothetical protein